MLLGYVSISSFDIRSNKEQASNVVWQGFYTNFIVWVFIQTKHTQTNILPPTGTAGMSQAELDERVYGSKITFVAEESMVMTQVLCKTCMCLVYYKLT